MLPEATAIFAVALLGGLLPAFVRWSERHLHAALALSTGFLLGAVFLHLLPSLAQFQLDGEALSHGELAHAGEDLAHAGHEHGGVSVWHWVLAGVMAVYLAESLFLRPHDADDAHRHRAVGYAALIGLTLHALTAGIAFGAAASGEMAGPLFLAIVGHKAFEAFSLTTVFRLAEAKRTRLLWMVCIFSLVTPLGMLLGEAATAGLGHGGQGIATALAAGTFLYVALSELLPEVFHHREDSLAKVALIAGGIGAMALFHGMGA